MVDLDDYDGATIEKAFWLQEKIRRDGIEGIGFMQAGRNVAVARGGPMVARKISKHLKRI